MPSIHMLESDWAESHVHRLDQFISMVEACRPGCVDKSRCWIRNAHPSTRVGGASHPQSYWLYHKIHSASGYASIVLMYLCFVVEAVLCRIAEFELDWPAPA